MPGAGLGLAIVARIAHANDATADVRTGPDGSTFSLAFPPARAPPKPCPPSRNRRGAPAPANGQATRREPQRPA